MKAPEKIPAMKTKNRIVKSLIGAVLPLLVAFGSTPSAKAQTVSRIAFHAAVTIQKKHLTYSQIFSMNPDGSGVVQLTSANAMSYSPAWSPGQQYIAFDRGGTGVPLTVMVMEAKGEVYGGRSFPVVAGQEPDWSP